MGFVTFCLYRCAPIAFQFQIIIYQIERKTSSFFASSCSRQWAAGRPCHGTTGKSSAISWRSTSWQSENSTFSKDARFPFHPHYYLDGRTRDSFSPSLLFGWKDVRFFHTLIIIGDVCSCIIIIGDVRSCVMPDLIRYPVFFSIHPVPVFRRWDTRLDSGSKPGMTYSMRCHARRSPRPVLKSQPSSCHTGPGSSTGCPE